MLETRMLRTGGLAAALLVTMAGEAGAQTPATGGPARSIADQPRNPANWLRIGREADRTDVFVNYDRIWPVDRLSPSPKPRTYPRDVRPIEPIAYTFEGKASTVGDYMTRANVNGLLVLKDGKVLYEAYRNGVGPDSQHSLWSASKSYTVTILGIAIKEGVIRSLDDTVETYAPQFKGTAYGPVSLRHVAMMSSGVQFFHDKGTPNRLDMYRQLLGGRTWTSSPLNWASGSRRARTSTTWPPTPTSCRRRCAGPMASATPTSCRRSCGARRGSRARPTGRSTPRATPG